MQPDVLPLVPVCSQHFAHKIIDSEEGCTIKEFCIQNKLNATTFNIFLTVEHLPKGMRDQPPHDAILMNRVFNRQNCMCMHNLAMPVNELFYLIYN